MKMLQERMRANNIILQDHEIKYKTEKAWRDVKKAGLNFIVPVVPGVLDHQIADSREDARREELIPDPRASSQRP